MPHLETNFVILNGIIVTLVVISILVLRRRPSAPVKLELHDESRIASDLARDVKVVGEKPPPKFNDPRLHLKTSKTPVGWDSYQPRAKSRARANQPRGDNSDPLASGRALNAFFNWNGHTWDAYEVLDLPAGSSKASAQVAFERASALADQETLPFLQAARDVILES